ncbi:hypothetical protein ACHQM5_013745 [Ranunculus cassubicifolius]
MVTSPRRTISQSKNLITSSPSFSSIQLKSKSSSTFLSSRLLPLTATTTNSSFSRRIASIRASADEAVQVQSKVTNKVYFDDDFDDDSMPSSQIVLTEDYPPMIF